MLRLFFKEGQTMNVQAPFGQHEDLAELLHLSFPGKGQEYLCFYHYIEGD